MAGLPKEGELTRLGNGGLPYDRGIIVFPAIHVLRVLTRVCVRQSRRALTSLFAIAFAMASLLAVASESEGQGWTANWTQRADAPTGPRGWFDFTFGTVSGQPVLFGGGGGSSAGDLWQYDTAADRWLQLQAAPECPAGLAQPSAEYAVEYDPVNQLAWMSISEIPAIKPPFHMSRDGGCSTPFAYRRLACGVRVSAFRRAWELSGADHRRRGARVS